MTREKEREGERGEERGREEAGIDDGKWKTAAMNVKNYVHVRVRA